MGILWVYVTDNAHGNQNIYLRNEIGRYIAFWINKTGATTYYRMLIVDDVANWLRAKLETGTGVRFWLKDAGADRDEAFDDSGNIFRPKVRASSRALEGKISAARWWKCGFR